MRGVRGLFRRRSFRVVGILLILAVAATACGEDDPAPAVTGEALGADDAVPLDVVGKDFAFDTTALDVAADTAFVVNFENQDSGVPHNFAIFRGGAGVDLVSRTEIVNGPVMQQLAVDGLESGTYTYICEVHPTTMIGRLTVG